jgi:solute carrier family 13 (sodium-dependent dicarboxylate transporter), member 2/3/5
LKTNTRLFRDRIGLAAGIVLFIFFQLVNPLGVDQRAVNVLSVAALMITWWVTEALPMPIVALVPLVLLPIMKVMPIKEVAANYADHNIYLFMGGFMLGLAIEKWGLHKRIALGIVNFTGTSGNRIILGFILATGFLSMWLSNTATTMMMYPIAASVIGVVRENHSGKGNLNNFALAIMLAIAYASNFGGIATVIGTPPNVQFRAMVASSYNYNIAFFDWMVICTPIALMLVLSLYVVMTRFLYPNKIASEPQTRLLIKNELEKLGPMSAQEKRVLFIFSGTAIMWIFKDVINLIPGVQLEDTIIALIGATALFICPVGGEGSAAGKKLLEWSDTSKMAWGILLLFGGGIALADALGEAGLIKMLGEFIARYSSGGFVLIVVITFVSLFISEVMSNIAQVIVFTPVIFGIANAIGVSPILLGLPMCLGASCASMMPMGTPPNAIAFASGYIKFGQMMRTGFVMNIIAGILISLFCWYLVPLLMTFTMK